MQTGGLSQRRCFSRSLSNLQQHTHINQEAREGERIAVKHNSARVSQDFVNAAQNHANHKAPCLPPQSLQGVDDHCDGEERDEDTAGSEGRFACEDAPIHWAEIQRAVGVWPVRDEVVG